MEDCLIASWPAFRHHLDGTWLARSADGVTGRANALLVLDPADDTDVEARLDAVEAFYRAQGLRPTVRTTPLTPPALVACLDRRGYGAEDETLVLAAPLARLDVAPVPSSSIGVEHVDWPDLDWVAAAVTSPFRDCRDAEAMARILDLVACPRAFLTIRDPAGTTTGVALVAVHRGLATVHAVAVRPQARRRGLARLMMGSALAFARDQGAHRFWVGVVADNRPARALYEGLGLEPVFNYRYRRAPR